MRDDAQSSGSGLPALDRIVPTLRVLAPTGFILINGLGYRGHEFFYSEYPKEWQWEYESRNYVFFDPILLWALTNESDTRWSAIRIPDVRKVMASAERFGIRHGAVFARGGVIARRKKTVLSMSRGDRDYTDEEMLLLSAMLDQLIQDISNDPDLTDQELEVMRRFRDGLGQKEIADALDISVTTVKARLTSATRKLGGTSPVNALVLAVQRHLL